MRVCLQDWIFGEPSSLPNVTTLTCANRRGITYIDPNKSTKEDPNPEIFEFRYGGSYNIYLTMPQNNVSASKIHRNCPKKNCHAGSKCVVNIVFDFMYVCLLRRKKRES